MISKNLNMILKIREWEEEIERQKFSQIIGEKNKIEFYINELENRFNLLKNKIFCKSNSDEIFSLYSEIEYLITLISEAKEILNKINEEFEKQRQIYEDHHKEKKKIEQLYDKLLVTIRKEREKLEEKIMGDLFTSRYRRKQ